jgi:hypothetical protein
MANFLNLKGNCMVIRYFDSPPPAQRRFVFAAPHCVPAAQPVPTATALRGARRRRRRLEARPLQLLKGKYSAVPRMSPSQPLALYPCCIINTIMATRRTPAVSRQRVNRRAEGCRELTNFVLDAIVELEPAVCAAREPLRS